MPTSISCIVWGFPKWPPGTPFSKRCARRRLASDDASVNGNLEVVGWHKESAVVATLEEAGDLDAPAAGEGTSASDGLERLRTSEGLLSESHPAASSRPQTSYFM